MDGIRDWGRVAALLLEAAGDRVTALGHPIWVQVLDRPDLGKRGRASSFDLALSDAEDGLMGQVAAPNCQAVGMIGSGRLRPTEPGPPAGPAGSVGPVGPGGDAVEAVRMVCLVTRDGGVTWRMARADGSPPRLLTTDVPPTEGRLLDCLRRCLGLSTSPPPSPAGLQLIVWLVAALERSEGSRRPLTWSEVSRLHPVARLLASELEAPAFRASGITDALTRMGAAAYSWEDIRRQACQQEGFLDDIIRPDLARWMDDGMFARWVLSDLPSVDELFVALRPRLTPSAARRMAHAIHAASTTQAVVVT